MKDDSIWFPTLLRLVFLGALVPATLGCHDASQPLRSEIHLTFNTCREQNPNGMIRRRNRYTDDVDGLMMTATICPDEAITERGLRDLRDGMHSGRQLQLGGPFGENWNFFVSFNFEDPVVLLELTGTDAMRVNGRAYNHPLTLMPGAHGFSVTANGSEIEHRFIPMKGD